MDSKRFVEENVGRLTDLKSLYKFFQGLNYKTLTSDYKGKDVFDLRRHEKEAIEEIYTIANYKKQFQIFLIKLKEANSAVIRSLPELFLRESRYPFLVFTPDFVNYTFTFVEKIRKDVGEFQRRIIKLKLDVENPYHTDKLILSNIALKPEIKAPSEINAILKQAFDVEKVTKQFFTEYRGIYELLVEKLKEKNKHLAIFKQELSEENFAKKLLGRLTFLYFIQKKGWLGAKEKWGDGDKKFLYHWFVRAKNEDKNYYRNILEPLFYDTLNNPRNEQVDRNYSKRFESSIPFLNGGLFEPDYPWDNPEGFVSIDNSLFEKVFAVFEKYNFTVKEDEPLEKEVAVDPEMLGKVFENLLPENLRKGKGTYYTPREIVHYMCQESLINHLVTETGLSAEGVRAKYFPVFNTTKDKKFKTRDVETNEKIVKTLKNTKILDPACGSGAFLVGMLQLITKLRFDLEKILFTLRKQKNTPTEYDIKKETIQNSIYGVDIDPGAVEIAKLRLWLSLIVDYEIGEIEPLPNLDYKLMVGNSLLDEFMGIKLFDIEKVKGKKIKRMKTLFEEEPQINLFGDVSEKAAVLKTLQDLQKKLFAESDLEKKKQIKKQVEKIEFDLIEATVKDELKKLDEKQVYIETRPGIGLLPDEVERIRKISSKKQQVMETLKQTQESNVKPFFLFELHFSEVFEKKGGFDVVIANPPYNAILSDEERSLYKNRYDSVKSGRQDSAAIFVEKGGQLGNTSCNLAFILPYRLFSRKRNHGQFQIFTLDNFSITQVIYLGTNVDFTASDEFMVLVLKNKRDDLNVVKVSFKPKDISTLSLSQMSAIRQKIWRERGEINLNLLRFNQDLLLKIKKGSIGLTQICHVKDGIVPFIREKLISEKKEDQRYVKFVGIAGKYELDRYCLKYQNLYLCYDINEAKKYITDLNELRKVQLRDKKIFLHRKIITAQNSRILKGTIDNDKLFVSNSIHSTFLRDRFKTLFSLEYILALMNSNLINYYHDSLRLKGTDLHPQILISNLRKLPIKQISLKKQQPFVNLVNKIFSITKSKDYLENDAKQAKVKEYEKQIDQLVYKLYNLPPEEIKIVEKSTK